MASMADRMVDQAEALLDLYPSSGAARRCAVSGAYYAVFHALVASCAETLLPDEPRNSEAYERVYRALDHGPMKNAFRNGSFFTSQPVLLEIGAVIVELQSVRMKADYAPPRAGLFTVAEVREHFTKARKVIQQLDNLGDSERRRLAVHLLFKERPRD